jgi:catechol-2,3-dioxygenase
MPAIARLGHVGLHVRDVEREKAFFRDVLGLTITDEGEGMVFFSARPDEEHHEFLLVGGRDTPDGAAHVQQVSFRCDTLEDVIGFSERFEAAEVEIDMIVTHGNAVSVYFFDPEGNRCEVYWGTGLEARQPYLDGVDLTRPAAEIVEGVQESVAKHGKTGFVDHSLLRQQGIDNGA